MPIERAHVFALKLQADRLGDLVAELRRFADDIEAGNVGCGILGGPSFGAVYHYRHDPAQTHDRYFSQIEETAAAAPAKLPIATFDQAILDRPPPTRVETLKTMPDGSRLVLCTYADGDLVAIMPPEPRPAAGDDIEAA